MWRRQHQIWFTKICWPNYVYSLHVLWLTKMKEKPPQGNGTVHTIVSIKIKNGTKSHVWCEFYGKKAWIVNARDVEWLIVELAEDSEDINGIKCELDQLKQNFNINEKKLNKILQFTYKQQQFKTPSELHEVMINLTLTQICDFQESFKCQMKLFPVNINTPSMEHKLQRR